MCGIICAFHKKEIEIDMLPMLDSIKHRGQDQVSINEYEKCTVGFRRLAITDLGAHQPEGKKWKIYLNGEIYNYKELGYIGTECSVISQGLENEGLDFVKKLNGMFFILAILDSCVYVFRDRYGIKPVYYWQNEDVIIVASEIKAILKYKDYNIGINESARKQWMIFNNCFTDETLFKGIYKLEKGTIWHLNSGNKVKYWQWNFAPQSMGYWSAIEKIEELFLKSLERQTPKEVLYGSCLSGGIDSGIIVNNLTDCFTFTAGFTEGNDERELAELSGQKHYEIVYNKIRDFEKTIYHLEDLRVGASWSNYGLYEMASKYVKVLFDGAGADELFGGYTWRYNAPNYYDVVNRTGENCSYCESLFEWQKLDRYKFDAEHFLEGVLLVVDKLSMAHTIEVRLPFLDNDLVDFALTLPIEFKENKRILKDTFSHLLPDEILAAKKQGFSSPDWFPGEGNQANKWATAAYNQWIKTFL